MTNLNTSTFNKFEDEVAARGTGKLLSSNEYLKNDPTTYYYNKFKTNNSKYLNDEMWSEASKRGELDSLISYIETSNKVGNESFDKWNEYQGYNDYDSYMVAMAIPSLDNTVKKDRTYTDIDGNTQSLGSYTDQEWAKQILNNAFGRYEAALLEEQKKNDSFINDIRGYLTVGAAETVAGITQFTQDVFTIGQGVLNMIFNFSGDESIGDRFLYAFSDEGIFDDTVKFYTAAAYDYARRYTSLVDAVEAYDQGYVEGTGDMYLFKMQSSKNDWAGVSSGGELYKGLVNSVGYMIPTIILTAGIGTGAGAAANAGKISLTAAKTISTIGRTASRLTFYAGIFSGNISDTVDRYAQNGISYKDLNAGKVIANAGIKAAAQLVIEELLGRFLKFSTLDRLLGATGRSGGTIAKRLAGDTVQAATRRGIKAGATVVKDVAIDALKEGIEETLQDLSDNLIDMAFGGEYKARGIDNLTFENLLNSFILGSITSLAISSISTSKFAFDTGKAVVMDENGEATKLGIFQSMNYRKAVDQMEEWNSIITNEKSSAEEVRDATFKLAVAVDTISSVMRSMGADEAIKANKILAETIRKDGITDEINKQIKDGSYATNLFTKFIEHGNQAILKYMTTPKKNKLKEALSNLAIFKKFANKGVTTIENVITEEMPQSTVTTETNISNEALSKINNAMRQLGSELIVGVDGNVIAKSNKVLFVDNSLLINGDIETIIKGLTFENARATVIAKLSQAQKNMILSSYNKILNTTGTIEEAVDALLFDKSFYTFILLNSKERNYKQQAFDMLATVNKLVEESLSKDINAGRLEISAYKTLMTKIRDTMRTGLVNFCTQYENVDLGIISNDILPTDLKQLIQNHKNVIFTNNVNKIMTSKIFAKRISEFNRYIDTCTNLPQSYIDAAKQKIKSNNINDIIDACSLLIYSKKVAHDTSDKLVYLPNDSSQQLEQNYVKIATDYIGMPIKEFIDNSNPNVLQLSQDFVTNVIQRKLDITDRTTRESLAREAVFYNSAKTLTIDSIGNIVRVIDKNTLLKPEFISDNKALFMKILRGITLQDICNIKLPKQFAEITIKLKSDLAQSNAIYDENTNTILISSGNKSIADSIMHELTHVTQKAIYQQSRESSQNPAEILSSQGGSSQLFEVINKNTFNSIKKYAETNFDLAYKFLSSANNLTEYDIVYFLLDGELQANSTMSSMPLEAGFRWKDNRKILVSPDGKKEWKILTKLSDIAINSDKDIDIASNNVTDITNTTNTTNTTNAETSVPAPDMANMSNQYGEEFYSNSRFISDKIANESNLKYFKKKGRSIYMHPNLKRFIIATTHDFASLDPYLQKQIKAGKLTYNDIKDYAATTTNMNDFTFKSIANYIYNNEEAAKLDFKQMRKILDSLEELATISYIIKNDSVKLTPEELFTTYTTMANNKALEQEILKASKRASTTTDSISQTKVEISADPLKLTSQFLALYDGTFKSIRNLNNYGKWLELRQTEQSLILDAKTGDINRKTKVWNFIDRMKKANIDYNSEFGETLIDIPQSTKLDIIRQYLYKVLGARLLDMSDKRQINAAAQIIVKKVDAQMDSIMKMTDEEIDKRFLIASKTPDLVKNIGNAPIGPIISKDMSNNDSPIYLLRRSIRSAYSTLKKRISGLKKMYDKLSPETKKYIDPNNGYKLNPSYIALTETELEALIKSIQADSKKLGRLILSSSKKANALTTANKRITSLQSKVEKLQSKVEKLQERKTIAVKYRTTIKQQNFSVESEIPANDVVKKLLDTGWNDTRMSTVKKLSNNREANIASGKIFFEQNAQTILSSDINDITDAANWFLDSRLNNFGDLDAEKFSAIKFYFLGYVFSKTSDGEMYSNLDNSLKTKIETYLKETATTSARLLAIWQNIVKEINPLETMINRNIEIDGVLLTDTEKQSLFEAAESGNIDQIKTIQNTIINRVAAEKTSKKSFLRVITAYRSMAMLSSPITWLRNIASNVALDKIYKLSDAIGKRLFSSKSVEGQLKLDAKVSDEITNFINTNFINNGLFDTLVSNLSRYNPSDIIAKKNTQGKTVTKEDIFSQLVLNSMYSKYYSENMFKSNFMKSVHQKLMKVMSDNSFVRKSAVNYFGKMLAEKQYNLSDGKVTDGIMSDFANSIGLALSDYMHSDNIFNDIEKKLANKSEVALFAYKTILPFASASYQWFKAALKMSPVGLGRAIVNMAKLEQRVAKASAAFNEGKSNLSPELVEYMTRRDFGMGVIGTVNWCLGIALAAFGFIDLEDDDYGKPKLRIGKLRIDVSSLFGSSSLLAGAALITGFKDKGVTYDGWIEAMNRAADVVIDGFPIMQIIEMDMYSNGTWSTAMDQLESIALSFIPNIVAWIAGGTYSGQLNKTSFFGRAAAKIPFLASIVNEKKINPYTGEDGSWWDAFNRVVPYFSVDTASETEAKSKALGLNKDELRGNYTINDSSFNVTGSTLTKINTLYGEWNAKDLKEFYSNNMSVKVKVDNKYVTLKYNQMTSAQRKKAVENIMGNNAELAKIAAWTYSGHKYYASSNLYVTLRKKGLTSNIYKGSAGFVE